MRRPRQAAAVLHDAGDRAEGRQAVSVTGSPGGSRIISTVLQVINVLDHEMSLADALTAPRLHHQWLPDQVSAERGYPAATLKALEARGHSVMVRVPGTSANSVLVTPAGLVGAADTRSRGALAAGN